MKYLYTKEPDEHCHEVEPGIYGRPTHTTEQSKLRKLGWVDSIHSLKEADHGLRKDEEEGRQEEGQVDIDSEYERVLGKKPHHLMKEETKHRHIAEALKDD